MEDAVRNAGYVTALRYESYKVMPDTARCVHGTPTVLVQDATPA